MLLRFCTFARVGPCARVCGYKWGQSGRARPPTPAMNMSLPAYTSPLHPRPTESYPKDAGSSLSETSARTAFPHGDSVKKVNIHFCMFHEDC